MGMFTRVTQRCSMVATGILLASSALFGQASTQSLGSFDFNSDGVVFQSADSSTRVLMRFRMQNWATYTTKTTWNILSSWRY